LRMGRRDEGGTRCLTDEIPRVHRDFRKVPEDLSVRGDEVDLQLLGEGDVFAIISGARRARYELQNPLAPKGVFVGPNETFRKLVSLPGIGDAQAA